jgi:hypothetical protein
MQISLADFFQLANLFSMLLCRFVLLQRLFPSLPVQSGWCTFSLSLLAVFVLAVCMFDEMPAC